MSSSEFYQQHLNQVSRSFAFCIEPLVPELKKPISFMYLVCRIIDTIEDSPWPDIASQSQCFDQLLALFTNDKSVTVQLWLQNFSAQAKPSEVALINDISILLEDFKEFSKPQQEIILTLIEEMSAGMSAFQMRFSRAGEGIRLNNMFELNEYCYYVAGLVGKALTELMASTYDDVEVSDELLSQSFHFGLFLQKINLLKDQREDASEGRNFIFDRLEVIDSLNKHAMAAMQYILNIPERHKTYRQFCAWSLFLAIGSLSYIEQSYLTQKNIKISRLETKLLISMVSSVLDSNVLLEKFFLAYMKTALNTYEAPKKNDNGKKPIPKKLYVTNHLHPLFLEL